MSTPQHQQQHQQQVQLPRRKANEIESPGDPGPPIIVPPDEDPLDDERIPAEQHPPPQRGI